MADLPFHDLASRHPGVTKALGDTFTEAARVCLDRHHASPITVVIDARDKEERIARWRPCDDRERGAWPNEIDATEFGAYGVALAAVEVAETMVAVRRAETGTGCDYYIAPPGTSTEDLEACIRLEVSGMDRGEEVIVLQRLNQKVQQALKGDSNLPALAAVVGFRVKLVRMARVESNA
jgi:hypothetical protein